jgi:AsmA protein
MNKVVKYCLLSVGSVAGLLAVALICLPFFFDLNDYKGQISDIVHDATGRTLTFDGNLYFSLLPHPSILADNVTFSNAKGFSDEPMAHVDHASISIRILPLLSGEIQLGQVVVEGASVYLGRNGAGVYNWDDLVGKANTQKTKEEKTVGGLPVSLFVAGVKIKDTRFTWGDQQSDRAIVVENCNAKIGAFSMDSTFPVELSLDVVLSNPELRAAIEIAGNASIDLEKMVFGAKEVTINTTAEGKIIPSGKIDAKVVLADAVFDSGSGDASVTALKVSANGATAYIDAMAEGVTEGVKKAMATVTVEPFNAKEVLGAHGIKLPEMYGKKAMTSVEFAAEAEYISNELIMKSVKASIDGCSLDGKGRIKFGKVPYYFARINMGDLNVDQYLPPKIKRRAKVEKPVKDKPASNEPLYDVEMLRKLHVDAEANIASALVENIKLEKIKVAVKAKDGVITVNPASLGLYDGRIESAVHIDASKKIPITNVAVKVVDLDVGAAMLSSSGEKSVAGILDMETAMQTTGNQVVEMRNNLTGNAKFNLADGKFPGVNLFRIALLTHKSGGKGDKIEGRKEDSTSFGQVLGSFKVANGVVSNEDLEVKAPGLRAEGHGLISLVSKDIDYLVKVKLVATQDGQGGAASKDMYGVMVPVRVGGQYDNPIYWVSLTEYVKALAGVAISLGGGVIDVTGNVVGGAVGITGSVLKGVGKGIGYLIPGFGGASEDEKKPAKHEKK